MTVDRRALAGAIAALLLVAACGGSATQAPGATEAPGATQAPAATAAPTATPEAVATPEPAETEEAPEASLTAGAASALEARLPGEVNGVKFDRTSFNGDNFPVGLPVGDTDMDGLLSATGKTARDINVAVAAGSDTNAGTFVMALQIEGAPTDKLQAWADETMGSGGEKSTVGGKEVYGQVIPGVGGAFFYVKDDTIYYVVSMGGPEGLAEAIVSKLP